MKGENYVLIYALVFALIGFAIISGLKNSTNSVSGLPPTEQTTAK